jgi:TatA/E family protein of Tat protein translocase
MDSPAEILVVLAIALIVFGPQRLPGLARSLGAAIRELREAISGDADDAASPEHTTNETNEADGPTPGH